MAHSWKTWLWRTLLTTAVIAIIAASFYAEENSRGMGAWKNCEREIMAHGESLKWENFIPPPVPDEQNFYKAPMMTAWFAKGTTNYAGPPIPANPQTTANVITEISASNYIAWSAAFETNFDLMREAVKRPLARLDGDYTLAYKQPIPNFVNYRFVTQTLAHRAKCHLVLGEPDKALADLTLLHQLNRVLVKGGRPNTLVNSMIHVAISGLYADAIACGLDSHSWREPELAALQQQLAEINLLPPVAFSFQAERAGMSHMLDYLTPDQLMRVIHGSTRQASDFGWWLMPSGWIQQNKAIIATSEGRILGGMSLTNRTVSPYKILAATRASEQNFRHVTPWNFLAAMATPNFNKALQSMARNQTWVDHAQIVCALERYRLLDGKYPATLADLSPRFISTLSADIIGGKPMNYSRKADQTFLLYSVGWNEADDGGITAHTGGGKEDSENGDWVWQYLAK